MSLFIRGLSKPINCEECHALGYDKLSNCSQWWELDFKESDCPLEEATKPHGRLIDADEVYNHISLRMLNGRFENVLAAIDESPTIISAEN